MARQSLCGMFWIDARKELAAKSEDVRCAQSPARLILETEGFRAVTR